MPIISFQVFANNMEYEIVGNTLLPHCYYNKEKISLVRKLNRDYNVYSNGYVVQYVHDVDVVCTTPIAIEEGTNEC